MISINMAQVTKDLTRITGKLGKLGAALDDFVPQAVAPAVVELMKIYEPPKRVTRKAAYGKTFQSLQQQRYFFWALANGIIDSPYNRTKGMKDAWRIEGKGKNTRVVNDTEAAKYTMGNETQSRHEKLVGWTTTGYRLKHPGRTILNAAIQGVRDAIKHVGL